MFKLHVGRVVRPLRYATISCLLLASAHAFAANRAEQALAEFEREFAKLSTNEQQQLLEHLAQTSERLATAKSASAAASISTPPPARATPLTDTKVDKDLDSLWNRIKVRESVYEKSAFSKPARVQYTSPDESDDSYSIDIGVTFIPWATERFLFGPKLEYHKNTLIDKEQDVFRAGFQGSYMFGQPVVFDDSGNVRETFALWSDIVLDYKKDSVKDKRSWEASLLATPLYTPWGIGGAALGTDTFRFGFDLVAGAEYENGKSDDLDKSGDTFRALGRAGIVIYPLFGLANVGSRLELSAYGTVWQELANSGLFDDNQDFFRLYRFGITYYFNNDRTIGLNLSRVQGDDPSQDLLDQKYTQLGVVFKIGK